MKRHLKLHCKIRGYISQTDLPVDLGDSMVGVLGSWLAAVTLRGCGAASGIATGTVVWTGVLLG